MHICKYFMKIKWNNSHCRSPQTTNLNIYFLPQMAMTLIILININSFIDSKYLQLPITIIKQNYSINSINFQVVSQSMLLFLMICCYYLEQNFPCFAFCSCCSLMFSSLTGLGMNPISQPSFTNRPIHQSLLNFYRLKKKKKRSNLLRNYCIWDHFVIIFNLQLSDFM